MEIEEILKEIGFSDYKAKVYKTLLYLGIASSATVAKESGVPQTKVHGILNELAKEGFAIIIPGRPTRFKAIPPSSAIVPIIEEKIQKESRLKEEVKRAEQEFISKEIPKKEILLFQGWNVIERIIEKALSKSKEEVDIFIRFRKLHPEFLKRIEKLVKKGVKVKVLGPYRKEREHVMLQYKLIGCEVKVIKEVYFPLITFDIFDKNILHLYFFSFSSESEGLLVRIEDKDTTKLFRDMFDKLWGKAKPI